MQQERYSVQSFGSVSIPMSTMDTLKICLLVLFAFASYTKAANTILCYYDSRSNFRTGLGKFDLTFMDSALTYCTYLVYGYAGINPKNYKMVPLNEQFDVTREHYRHVIHFKRKFPGLQVLLSVGGGVDVSGEGSEKNLIYRTLIESVDQRLAFINSAKDILNRYGFDGLDLAWEFPENKPKKTHSNFSILEQCSVGIKRKIVEESVLDEKAEKHKEQFTALIREIKNSFRLDDLLLTLSVLPNVNSSVYYDVGQLAPHLDFVILHAYDFYTPERNPKEAGFSAPLYEVIDRKYDENGDFQTRYWVQNGCPNDKLIFGIPTYGRSWKMDDDSGLGPAEAGYTNEPGLLSYPEICTKIGTPNEIQADYLGERWRKVNDPTRRNGPYAFRLPKVHKEGIWVAFEDPDSIENKACSYVKAKGLGGVAIVDITLDDFRGLCSRYRYPLLISAKDRW